MTFWAWLENVCCIKVGKYNRNMDTKYIWLFQNQLTVMCMAHGKRRLIGTWCQKECVESKEFLAIRRAISLNKTFV